MNQGIYLTFIIYELHLTFIANMNSFKISNIINEQQRMCQLANPVNQNFFP